MGRLVGSRAGKNGIVPVHHPLEPENGLLDLPARVVARPFTKRSFESFLVVAEFAFEDDLRVCRNGQAGILPTQYFHRLLAETTDPIELRKTGWNLVTRRKEKQRIEA